LIEPKGPNQAPAPAAILAVGYFDRSRKMKKLLPILAFATFALYGCGYSFREVSVKEVTKSETITLEKKPSQGSVTSIHIAGHGSMVGKAEVQLILNGVVYKSESINGAVRFEWSGDWYSNTAEVRYISGTATSGSLTLQYAFR
jgi:hypothetical protein